MLVQTSHKCFDNHNKGQCVYSSLFSLSCSLGEVFSSDALIEPASSIPRPGSSPLSQKRTSHDNLHKKRSSDPGGTITYRNRASSEPSVDTTGLHTGGFTVMLYKKKYIYIYNYISIELLYAMMYSAFILPSSLSHQVLDIYLLLVLLG